MYLTYVYSALSVVLGLALLATSIAGHKINTQDLRKISEGDEKKESRFFFASMIIRAAFFIVILRAVQFEMVPCILVTWFMMYLYALIPQIMLALAVFDITKRATKGVFAVMGIFDVVVTVIML